jgi:hypothetical protein
MIAERLLTATLLSLCLVQVAVAVSLSPRSDLQQRIESRVALVTVTGTGGRPLIDLSPDDFVVDEADQAREILSSHIADYPVVLMLDNTTGSEQELATLRRAAANFIARIGERAVAVGVLASPTSVIASFEDARVDALERLEKVSGAAVTQPLVLEAVANGARLIRENGTPFSAIVILSARPVNASAVTDAEFLTPILESRAVVHVVANRASTPPSALATQDDVLKLLADQTGGQYTTIYSPVSFAFALDRLADRMATEMMIEYLVPPGGARGDVRVGVRIPGARATGLGVSR